MYWTFQAPHGTVFNLWHVPGSSAVRLQFEKSRYAEVAEWLREQAAALEAEATKPVATNPRIRPVVVQPLEFQKLPGQDGPKPPQIVPQSVPVVSDSVHITPPVPPEVLTQSQHSPPPPPDPPEWAVLKQAKQSVPPVPQLPQLIRPPLESLELPLKCPCQAELTEQAHLLEHWNEGHMDYAPPPEA